MIIISWLLSRIPFTCIPCLRSPIRPVLSIGCRHRYRLLHRVCTSNALLLANIITNWMQHSSNHPEDMFIVSCLSPTTAVSSPQCPQPMRLCHRIRSHECRDPPQFYCSSMPIHSPNCIHWPSHRSTRSSTRDKSITAENIEMRRTRAPLFIPPV